ncbi:hypothetical protein AGDE_15614 [Angomonas deanei]|uniref:Rapamycin-insensitive companion of mTOR, middle domain containing protein, putative n=1 Tax=Angomonas deanei TaxID=59799 RepID=A0A7G2CLR6_9TRYP|nr:hypothetical protein AGDE_15614 [Angomonas deanei]CAD2220766.1 Rapamycin-insensitive companion of mTOR, middle domain containing protein, putative [Angomonas deanei]|eukprot:EPY18762.1 hypothetical protein AGDE_15614 [Angomonas deanei]
MVGNLWLASETTSLRALIDLIHLPGEMDRRMIILTLFNKLLSRLAPHRGIVVMDTWNGEEEARRRRELKEAEEVQQDNFSINYSMGGPTDQMLVETVDPIEATEDVIPTMKALGYHVMDPLLGYVLLNLLHQGLPLALVASVTSLKFSRIALEATGSLLQDVVVLMDSVLPRNTVRVIHEAVNMSVGKLTFTKDSVAGDLTSKLFHVFKETQVGLCRDYTNGIEGTLWGQGMQSTQLYSSVGGSLDMEERAFRNAVVETRVETSPMDWKSWNFDLLHVLMQGPFRNRNRMASCTKLFRILIGFYTPPNANRLVYFRQFATLAAADVTQTMCQLCLEMTDLLLSTREGATLLNVAELPRAMIAVLKEVRHGKPKVLSKERVNSIVGQTVLRQMMRLTAHANGLILMREHGFFEEIDGLFAKLSGSRVSSPGPEDTLHEVCNQLLQYMCISAVPNFGVCDDLRHTFRQALTNESNSIRLCAATQLRRALLRDLSSSLAWGIEALVLAIQDSFLSVVECAFKLLLSICMSSNDALECLIKTKPSVLMESPIILANASKLRLNDLLYCIVKIPAGFAFCFPTVGSTRR